MLFGPADDRLREALVQQREVPAAARAELFPGPAATARTTRARAVADLGWGLLGARARGDSDLARGGAGAAAPRLTRPGSPGPSPNSRAAPL